MLHAFECLYDKKISPEDKTPPEMNAAAADLSLRFPGYRVVSKKVVKDCHTILALLPLSDPICPNCGEPCTRIKETKTRHVRDTSIEMFETVMVEVPIRRVRCKCGCQRQEKLDWLEPKMRITKRLVGFIQRLLRCQLAISEVAEFVNLDWATVKNADKDQLQHLFGEIDLKDVRHLAIDEFSLHKGHRYATVVIDAEQRKVIWIGKGKSQKSIEPFFQFLRDKGVDNQIQSVSCDMNAAYPKLFKENLPNCTVAYDLFHVIKNFSEVLKCAKEMCRDSIRKQFKKRLLEQKKAQKPGRPPKKKPPRAALTEYKELIPAVATEENRKNLIKAEWILITRPEDLMADRQMRLNQLLKDNELLAALYPIAQKIREIWHTKDDTVSSYLIEDCRKLLLAIADRYLFKPAKQFARMLSFRKDGIIRTGKLGFGTSTLEGINNKIKVMKRIGYGFRDHDYFFLKIKSAFPGLRSNPWETLPKNSAVIKGQVWRSALTEAGMIDYRSTDVVYVL